MAMTIEDFYELAKHGQEPAVAEALRETRQFVATVTVGMSKEQRQVFLGMLLSGVAGAVAVHTASPEDNLLFFVLGDQAPHLQSLRRWVDKLIASAEEHHRQTQLASVGLD